MTPGALFRLATVRRRPDDFDRASERSIGGGRPPAPVPEFTVRESTSKESP